MFHVCEFRNCLRFRYSGFIFPRVRKYSRCRAAASAVDFSPDHYWRKTTRLVSYYALFKWWLPLSQHTRCHSNLTSLKHLINFRGLSWQSGLFSSRLWSLSPTVWLHTWLKRYLKFDWPWNSGKNPKPFSALPPFRVFMQASPKAISERTSYHRVW